MEYVFPCTVFTDVCSDGQSLCVTGGKRDAEKQNGIE